MIYLSRLIRATWRLPSISFLAVLLFIADRGQTARAVDDVLLQTVDGKIVTGDVDDGSFVGALGERVHRQQFLSNFRSANPGFVALATGSPSMPPGAQGFPASHDVGFDLLPMSIETVASNLFYWDGSDLNGGGLDISDVNFIVPTGVAWDVFDANFSQFAATGTNQLVPGGLIQRTSADVDPFDGVDTGMIHKHLVFQLSDNDGNSSTTPAQGVYMIAWHARSAGFETSDPFLFVMRTSMISNAVRDLAAEWAEANIEMLTAPPGIPGDYNDDGSVDAADYVVWRKTLGQIGEDLPADGDGSGQIDSGDFTVWKANFGNTLSPGGASSTAVPEAGIWPIVTAGVFGIALMRNRRVNRSIRLAIRGPIVILDERVIICRRMERKGSL